MKKLWDILLFPSKLYDRLTDNKVTLVAGVLLVGLVDFFLPDVLATCKLYFTGKPVSDIRLNIVIAAFMVLFLGVVNTVFFSLPLFDIFKFFKKKEGLPHKVTLIKVIKVYILSHFIMVPISTAAYFTIFRHINNDSSALVVNLSVALLFITMVWSAAIVARGINTLFSFNPFIRRLTFIIVFVWNYLFGVVFDMQIETWLLKIFR